VQAHATHIVDQRAFGCGGTHLQLFGRMHHSDEFERFILGIVYNLEQQPQEIQKEKGKRGSQKQVRGR
jgi:hypothetical protein